MDTRMRLRNSCTDRKQIFPSLFSDNVLHRREIKREKKKMQFHFSSTLINHRPTVGKDYNKATGAHKEIKALLLIPPGCYVLGWCQCTSAVQSRAVCGATYLSVKLGGSLLFVVSQIRLTQIKTNFQWLQQSSISLCGKAVGSVGRYFTLGLPSNYIHCQWVYAAAWLWLTDCPLGCTKTRSNNYIFQMHCEHGCAGISNINRTSCSG